MKHLYQFNEDFINTTLPATPENLQKFFTPKLNWKIIDFLEDHTMKYADDGYWVEVRASIQHGKINVGLTELYKLYHHVYYEKEKYLSYEYNSDGWSTEYKRVKLSEVDSAYKVNNITYYLHLESMDITNKDAKDKDIKIISSIRDMVIKRFDVEITNPGFIYLHIKEK